MNTESLIGTVLGTCTLQKIVGQGGMGAVFLAQQSRPRRQVAVKVLLPATSLTVAQKAAFLERFRRETDAAASLEHPNILHVHEYGEENGFAYLVVPYISGGTLRDEMEREGQLALPKAMNYLDQLAAALDFAHARGIVHRDIKPANILMTSDGRLLLTDFGLVKIVAEGQIPQLRLTGAGAPVGTPDYMSPEQVIGDAVDGRSDLYSLGIILYQMVTGTTPFQGETPMQIAAQQLQAQPPLPRIWRTDLPLSVEHVMRRALAKHPAERYARCQDFADAFRDALSVAGILRDKSVSGSLTTSSSTSARLYTPRSLFDPAWQTGAMAVLPTDENALSKPTGVLPTANADTTSTRSTGLLSRTGMFPKVGTTGPLPATTTNSTRPATTPTGKLPTATGILPASTGPQPMILSLPQRPTGALLTASGAQQAVSPTGLNTVSPVLNTTDALKVPNIEQAAAKTVKLAEPVKVVQVPVAGQPGKYVTGFLPTPTVPKTDEQPELPTTQQAQSKKPLKKVLFAVLALLLVVGPGLYWYIHIHSGQVAQTSGTTSGRLGGPADLKATATAHGDENIILSDPLSQNIHNFPVSKNEFFAGGTYHIVDTSDSGVAVVLAQKPLNYSHAYTLTMEELKGDDSTSSNSFGMIIRFNSVTANGKTIITFYSFEVTNTNGGEYQFWRYRYESSNTSANPWTEIWHQPFGSEFHEGQGPQSVNTFKIFENGNAFTFSANGKNIATAHDSAYPSGTLGMLVNLKGTEVAFRNMLITHS